MGNSFLDKALAYAKQATDADNAGDYDEALKLYMKCLDWFMAARERETSASRKKIIESKCVEFMDRVEELKDARKQAPPPTNSDGTAQRPSGSSGSHGGKSGPPGGGPPGSGGKRSKDDEEKDKMNANMESVIIREKPNVHWEDVAGLEVAKSELQEAVIMPIKFPQFFQGKRTPWKGILLYGPPGTGKTFLAKAIATECDSTFFSVSASTLMSKWQGESEQQVKALFEMARREAPSIVFVDEVDSLCSARSDNESESSRRVKTEFLVQMDGVGSGSGGVLVLGATNIPWGLDSAVRRRFERRVYIPLPDDEARKAMLKISIGETPNSLVDSDIEALSTRTTGFSGADISIAVRAALYMSLTRLKTARYFKRDQNNQWIVAKPSDPGATKATLMELEPKEVATPLATYEDFEDAFKRAKPSLSQEDILRHEEFTANYGIDGAAE